MKSTLYIITLILCFVGGIIFFTFKEDKKAQSMHGLDQRLLQSISNAWIHGGRQQDVKACSFFKDIPKDILEDFSKCHTEYLKCFLEKNYQFDRFEMREHVLTIDKKIKLKLNPLCHYVYLPQGMQSAGTKDNQTNLWDNEKKHFYVSRYYYHDKNDYKALRVSSSKKAEDLCEKKGLSLLESRVLDAISYKSQYVEESNFFYKRDFYFKKDLTDKWSAEKWCEKIFSKECFDVYPFYNFLNFGMGEFGVNYIQGGYAEFVKNRFNNERTFFPSSLSIVLDDKRHDLGHREKNDKEKGAFRCMLQL